MIKAVLFLTGLLFFLAPSPRASAQEPCELPPGERQPAHNWRLLDSSGSPPQYNTAWDGTIGIDDKMVVTIADGAAAGLRNDQMKIVLTAGPNVTWKKEVSAWSCSGKTQTISTS